MTIPKLVLALAILPLLAGCGPKTDNGNTTTPPGEQAPAAAGIDNTLVPSTTLIDGKAVPLKFMPGGLKYYDTAVGTGVSPKVGQTVSVRYTGTLLDGTKFDSSYDRGQAPFDFVLGQGQVIKGWDEGVATMKIGGKRRLVIPASLAYGSNPPTAAIPSDATLVFDVELVGAK